MGKDGAIAFFNTAERDRNLVEQASQPAPTPPDYRPSIPDPLLIHIF
ncbi:MAG: hypothetical protein AAF773_27160 [Cyanobacteria bacterium P01_D01_bin.115]